MPNTTDSESKLDRLVARSMRYPSFDKLVLSRNTGLGAAGFSAFALLTALLSSPIDRLLENAVLLFAVAIPLWVLHSVLVETLIVLGKRSYSYLKTSEFQTASGLLTLLAGGCTVGGLTLLLWRFSLSAAIAFLVSLAVSIGLIYLLYWHLESHIEEKERERDA